MSHVSLLHRPNFLIKFGSTSLRYRAIAPEARMEWEPILDAVKPLSRRLILRAAVNRIWEMAEART